MKSLTKVFSLGVSLIVATILVTLNSRASALTPPAQVFVMHSYAMNTLFIKSSFERFMLPNTAMLTPITASSKVPGGVVNLTWVDCTEENKVRFCTMIKMDGYASATLLFPYSTRMDTRSPWMWSVSSVNKSKNWKISRAAQFTFDGVSLTQYNGQLVTPRPIYIMRIDGKKVKINPYCVAQPGNTKICTWRYAHPHLIKEWKKFKGMTYVSVPVATKYAWNVKITKVNGVPYTTITRK